MNVSFDENSRLESANKHKIEVFDMSQDNAVNVWSWLRAK
jgi:hypothetical protein